MAPAAYLGDWVTFWIWAAFWSPFTLQWTLSNAYHNGARDFIASAGRVSPAQAEEFIEFLEMRANEKLVALEDLRDICIKYDVPLEEIEAIVRRGFW